MKRLDQAGNIPKGREKKNTFNMNMGVNLDVYIVARWRQTLEKRHGNAVIVMPTTISAMTRAIVGTQLQSIGSRVTHMEGGVLHPLAKDTWGRTCSPPPETHSQRVGRCQAITPINRRSLRPREYLTGERPTP